MKVCYFGNYNREYNRNQILIKGLKLNGVEVLECNSRKAGLAKYIDLFKKHQQFKNKYDVMVVGFPGYQSMWLAKFVCRKKIVFDAFSSIYDSMVFDRKKTKQKSPKALYYYLLDYVSCRLADLILLDTQEHIDYFVRQFKISQNKFKKILLGSDDSFMQPRAEVKNNDKFLVHFHGSNIPLQGVNYILGAAKLLEGQNISFNIIGSSIKKQYQNNKYTNVSFLDNVTHKDLSKYMSKADVCLGVFGDTDKANRVIANKVFEAMAAKCPIITGRSQASDNFFIDKDDVVLAKMADSQDLADKILLIKNNKELSNKISDNAYQLFQKTSTPKILGRELLNTINEIL